VRHDEVQRRVTRVPRPGNKVIHSRSCIQRFGTEKASVILHRRQNFLYLGQQGAGCPEHEGFEIGASAYQIGVTPVAPDVINPASANQLLNESLEPAQVEGDTWHQGQRFPGGLRVVQKMDGTIPNVLKAVHWVLAHDICNIADRAAPSYLLARLRQRSDTR
jgi:hypothetical protein